MKRIKRIDILKAIYEEPKPIDFVIYGFEAGTVGILSGAGSVGKGYFSIHLGFAIADTTETTNFLGLCEKRGRVGLVTSEDGERVLIKRIHEIGQYIGSKTGFKREVFEAVNENFDVVSVQGMNPSIYSRTNDYSVKKRIKAWQEGLERFCTGRTLVIVDTFRRFFDGEENSSGDVSEALKIFESIAHRTGCAILLTHHTSKSGSIGERNDEQESARGSSAITANARYQISLAKMSKEQAKKLNVPEEKRGYYLQVDIPKVNYAAPIEKKWLQRLKGGVLEEINLNGTNKVGINPNYKGRDDEW